MLQSAMFILLTTIFLVSACSSARKTSGNDAQGDQVETIGIEKTESNGTAQLADSNAESKSDASAEKQDSGNSPRDLIGSWRWIKTDCCGRTSKAIYPMSDEPPRIISFDENGKATYFTDGTKERLTEVPYKIGQLAPGQPTVKIGEHQPAMFTVRNDSLILSWGYMDLQVELYSRVE